MIFDIQNKVGRPLLLLPLLVTFLFAQTVQIPWWSINSGGSQGNSTGYKLNGSIAQSSIGIGQSIDNIGYFGFWHGFKLESYIPGWSQNIDVPSAPSGKTVYWGGSLTTDGIFIYTLKGNKTTDFYRYNTWSCVWEILTSIPLGTENKAVAAGGALAYLNGRVYAFKGNITKVFYCYDIASNAWSKLANIPGAAELDDGSALVAVENEIYAIKGRTKQFYVYNPTDNTWMPKADLPSNVNSGGALTYDGTTIYALRGDRATNFYSYDITSDIWVSKTNVPLGPENKPVADGGALAYLNIFIYAFKGGKTQFFYRYDIANDSWVALETIPQGAEMKDVYSGGALVAVRGRIYALKGNHSLAFWKYTPSPEYQFLAQEEMADNVQSYSITPIIRMVKVPTPTTKAIFIHYSTNVSEPLRISLYDVMGRRVRTIYDSYSENLKPGAYTYKCNENELSVGIYLLKLETGNYQTVRKVVLQK